MTVQKSQGSEFNHVLLILPPVPAPVLTRELIYTAITRASHRVEIWSPRPVFLEAAARRITRTSGLRDTLWPRRLSPMGPIAHFLIVSRFSVFEER
jgi:exodeoxyribonuclease V alpha subunit